MSKKCRQCGASVPGSASLFCNKCGARLPAERSMDPVICPTCGKTLPDRLSQFCDRCGAPLPPPVQPLPPVTPAMARKACPACGFENRGESLFYCKKCGTPLLVSEPQEKSPRGGVQDKPIRDRMVNLDSLQKKGNGGVAGPQVPSRRSRQETPQKRGLKSYRKIVIGIAVIVIILIAVVFINTGILGGHGSGSKNSSDSGFLGMLPLEGIFGAGSDNATAPGVFGMFSQEGSPANALFKNQATPVVTDTPLEPE